MDEVLTKSNTTLAEMEACESKGVSIYIKMKALNKSINDDKAYQLKAEGLIKTLNAELPKMNISYEVKDKKVEFKKYEDTIPNFFSRHINDYNECKKLMPYFDKAAGGTSSAVQALAK